MFAALVSITGTTIKHWVVGYFNRRQDCNAGILFDSLMTEADKGERDATVLWMHLLVCDLWPKFHTIPTSHIGIMKDCPQQPAWSNSCGIYAMM